MKKKVSMILATLVMLLSLNTLLPHPIEAQTTRVNDTLSIDTESIESVDTTRSIYPQVSFDLVESELPSDQVIIDESTIYSPDMVDLSEEYDNVVNSNVPAYEYVTLENFRDATTFVSLYIYNSELKALEIISPANISPDLFEFFTPAELIDSLAYDIQFKADHIFNYRLTRNLLDSVDLFTTYTPGMMADVKANVSRAEIIFNTVDENDPNYALAQESLDILYYYYDEFVRRYNSAQTNGATLDITYSENATISDQTEESVAVIEEAIGMLPPDFKSLLHTIQIVPPEELITSWNGDPIAAYATYNLALFFSDSERVTLGLVYHELGHILDFATVLYSDSFMTDYTSLSMTAEWTEIFNSEWNDPNSYYGTEIEAFAQAFGAYALEYYHGLTMDDVGYASYGLENRPQSYAYFEGLFQELGL